MPDGVGLGQRVALGAASRAGVAVAEAASRIASATASGCETVMAWEASTSIARAPALSAMKRDASSGTARSWVAMTLQEGICFQAAADAGAASACAAM